MSSESLGAGSLGDQPETADAVLGTNGGQSNGGDARKRLSEMSRSAAEKLDQQRGAAAGKLDSAAQALRNKAGSLPGGERVSSGATRAADKLQSAAGYIRDNDVDSMMEDLKRVVRDNPGPTLIGAAIVGFFIARSFYSDND